MGLILALGILVVGCTETKVRVSETDSTSPENETNFTNSENEADFTCPEDNKWFACRSMDDPVAFCGSEYWVDGRNIYESWLLKECPGIEILE